MIRLRFYRNFGSCLLGECIQLKFKRRFYKARRNDNHFVPPVTWLANLPQSYLVPLGKSVANLIDECEPPFVVLLAYLFDLGGFYRHTKINIIFHLRQHPTALLAVSSASHNEHLFQSFRSYVQFKPNRISNIQGISRARWIISKMLEPFSRGFPHCPTVFDWPSKNPYKNKPTSRSDGGGQFAPRLPQAFSKVGW